jgi:hypothetical protein
MNALALVVAVLMGTKMGFLIYSRSLFVWSTLSYLVVSLWVLLFIAHGTVGIHGEASIENLAVVLLVVGACFSLSLVILGLKFGYQGLKPETSSAKDLRQ